MLRVKNVGCDYARTKDKITLTEVTLYIDAPDKRDVVPEVFPNFKKAMETCGAWYDKMLAQQLYALLYRRNTVSAK